jgi:hypothetical protein
VIAELTKAVLGAVAKVRKTLAGRKPKLSRDRPSKRARKAARQSKRIGQKVAELFEHRYLFMKHHLSPAEQKTIRRITRGLPQLRTLRQIMDEVYRLFDRRCRTDTALTKLARLRRRVARLKQVGKTLQKLFSPNLEQALTFLWTTNVCPPRPTRWNVAIVATARCKRPSTAFAPSRASASALRWICYAMPQPNDAPTLRLSCTKPELDKPIPVNNDATVSHRRIYSHKLFKKLAKRGKISVGGSRVSREPPGRQ